MSNNMPLDAPLSLDIHGLLSTMIMYIKHIHVHKIGLNTAQLSVCGMLRGSR